MAKDNKVKSVETKKKKKVGNEDQVVENNINIKIDLSKEEDANKKPKKKTNESKQRTRKISVSKDDINSYSNTPYPSIAPRKMGTGYISQPNNQIPNPNLNNALQTINTALQTITSRPQITAPPTGPPALPAQQQQQILPPPQLQLPPPITITNTPGPTG